MRCPNCNCDLYDLPDESLDKDWKEAKEKGKLWCQECWEFIDRSEIVKKMLVKATGGCSINDGWPCGTCIADMVARESVKRGYTEEEAISLLTIIKEYKEKCREAPKQ